MAGPVSDWSEVPAKGCEPAALDDKACNGALSHRCIYNTPQSWSVVVSVTLLVSLSIYGGGGGFNLAG